jgi:hypothetical protein
MKCLKATNSAEEQYLGTLPAPEEGGKEFATK